MAEKGSDSRVVRIESGIKNLDIGWEYTNEDIVALISGLKEIPTQGGGFLGIGSFHNLDIALDRGAEAVALLDVSKDVCNVNQGILEVAEKTEAFEDMLPHVREYVQKKAILEDAVFEEYITTGIKLGSRIPLSWAKDLQSFLRLKQLISECKLAVAHANITKPSTLTRVGKFFASFDAPLSFANISNVESQDFTARRAIAKIPQSLYQAGGTNDTLVISSMGTQRPLPKDFTYQVLQPPISPLQPNKTFYWFEYNFLLRRLGDFSQEGPIIVPEDPIF